MIDPSLILIDAILDAPEISAELSGGVYAYRIPPEATPPLALVLIPGAFPAAPPSDAWWDYLATIDIHSDSPQKSLQIAHAVSKLIPTVVGSSPNGVVADCQVDSVSAITDGSWTPTRYRQVVTVDLTAREPQGG